MTSTSPLAPSSTETGSLVPHVPRRQVLRASLAVAAAGGVVATAGRTSAVGSESLPAWSDPATWGTAGVPRPGAVVVVDFPVRLDRDIDVAGLHVECGGHLVLDPQKSVTIRTTGNVEICGLLEMRPARAEVQHLLRFEGIDERRFAGGGMSVLASDVGLWIHEDGQLDLHGTPRTAWVRAAGALSPGARTIRLAAQPTGWRVGDELTITPTGTPVDKSHAARFDQATITSISGSVVTLSSALRYGHPQVAVGDGHVLTAEVLNLTRNVRIEGTPQGRTHTMALMVNRPSQVRYAAFRHFGPRQADDGYTTKVLGRYGLHFHMCQAGSRGSVIEGVVMRDGGSHAFVPHVSDGVTFRSCISYDTVETPYWWDQAPDTRSPAPPTHDALFDSCVAAKVTSDPAFRGFRLAGFNLGEGRGNRATGCVAVGVLGTTDSSGFHWPEGSHGVWDFALCVSHNNARHGIFTWQNDPNAHVVADTIAYHNGAYGISHGAYINGYTYRDSILYGNALGGFLMHAVSRDDKQLQLVNLLVDGAGLSPAAIELTMHTLDTSTPTVVKGCRLRGYREHGIWITGPRNGRPAAAPDLVDVIGCEFSGNKFWIADTVRRDSEIRVNGSARAQVLRRWDSEGRPREQWHARTQLLPSFRAVKGAPQQLSLALRRSAPL